MKSSTTKDPFTPHGGGIRGADVRRQSSVFEGRFGRMFRELPAAVHPKTALLALGQAMTADPEATEDEPRKPIASPETAEHIQDDEENTGLDAGYTYLGQFIDHDITFDPASSLMQQNDPESLVDFRTPRLDLDSLYGRGPADQPYMYIGDKFRLGKPLTALNKPTPSRDLPRYRDPENAGTPARALIGDKRNDENVIVSQLHGAFLQFHNRLVDELKPLGATFEDVQRLVRWHYQYVVLNDFLPRICGKALIDELLPHRLASDTAFNKKPKLQHFHWRNSPFMPLEFSVAAYRFGHSMVRPIYRLNTELKGGDNPLQATPDEKARGLEGRFFVFAGVQQRALNGFGEFPTQWAIDWSLFFDTDGSGTKGGMQRSQPAYKIDTSLVNPLGFLPEFSKPVQLTSPLTIKQMQGEPVDGVNDPANLAARNLLRGLSLQMPSGQAVARAMGLNVIHDRDLKVGKSIVDEWKTARPIVEIDPSFADNAPLWYYTLAEAQHYWFKRASKPGSQGDNEPVTLGPMGGRIVAETLIGLVYGDGHSYLQQDPNWEPVIGGRHLTMGQLIKYALTGAR
ncbi:MAG: hypothetical protein QOI59_2224 [Gammaproteobacteria bacterium]|jgi:hypothetical protein|nr:hypothetical protein [Gammaproteobacteria bacterium]